MIILILFLLSLFWLLGYISIPGVSLRRALFTVRGKPVTIWDVLIFFLIIWIIGSLPFPFQGIALVLLIVWLLGLVGIVHVANFSGIVILTIILLLIFYLLR